jgi:cytidine deaminase
MKLSTQVKKAYRQAVRAMAKAHAPYSRFRVGAAVISGNKIFTGCNVENSSYPAGICAERVAIVKMVSEGRKKVHDLVLVTDLTKPAAPCGVCLQVLAEFCDPDSMVWIGNKKKLHEVVRFIDLCPKIFTPKKLREHG